MSSSRISQFFDTAPDIDELYSLYVEMIRRNRRVYLGAEYDWLPEESLNPLLRPISRSQFETRVGRLRTEPHRYQRFLENLYRKA